MDCETLPDDDTLQELYSDRGWSKERIAREYDCTKTGRFSRPDGSGFDTPMAGPGENEGSS